MRVDRYVIQRSDKAPLRWDLYARSWTGLKRNFSILIGKSDSLKAIRRLIPVGFEKFQDTPERETWAPGFALTLGLESLSRNSASSSSAPTDPGSSEG